MWWRRAAGLLGGMLKVSGGHLQECVAGINGRLRRDVRLLDAHPERPRGRRLVGVRERLRVDGLLGLRLGRGRFGRVLRWGRTRGVGFPDVWRSRRGCWMRLWCPDMVQRSRARARGREDGALRFPDGKPLCGMGVGQRVEKRALYRVLRNFRGVHTSPVSWDAA